MREMGAELSNRGLIKAYCFRLNLGEHGRPSINNILCRFTTSLTGPLILQLHDLIEYHYRKSQYIITCSILVLGAMGLAKLSPPITRGCCSCIGACIAPMKDGCLSTHVN